MVVSTHPVFLRSMEACLYGLLSVSLSDLNTDFVSYSMGGADKWAQLRAEKAKLEGTAASIADQAKDKASQAVDAVKKSVS